MRTVTHTHMRAATTLAAVRALAHPAVRVPHANHVVPAGAAVGVDAHVGRVDHATVGLGRKGGHEHGAAAECALVLRR
jgi:hypothetical protein